MEVHASLVKAIVDTSKTDEEILKHLKIASNINQIIPLPEGATAVTAPHLGYNALMLACQYGRHKVVEALLDAGADPTIKCENLVPGASALHCAASHGHPKCLRLLLAKIEEIQSLEVRESILNAQKTKCGNTALHDAVGGAQVWVPSCSRFEKCVELLIRQPKINLDIPNNANGDTALHLAARSGNHTTVSQLLVFGANASLPNEEKNCVGPQLLSVWPEMFKLALDSCITLSDKDLYDPALEMHMDFEILIPKEGNETALLEKIAGKRDSDSIICHPLVEAFIQMEWHVCKTRRWLYIFVMTLILLALLLRVGYLMMKSSIAGSDTGDPLLTWVCLMFFGVISIAHILSTGWRRSVCKLARWLDVIVCIFLLLCIFLDQELVRIFAGLTFILITFRTALLYSSLPEFSLSLHLHLLAQIGRKMFCILLPILALVVIPFGVIFASLPLKEADTKNDDDQGQKSIGKIFYWIIRTLVMTHGEFDFTDLNINNWLKVAVFVLFVFIGALVTNALIGFAVSDTTELTRSADAHRLRNLARCVVSVTTNHICKQQQLRWDNSAPRGHKFLQTIRQRLGCRSIAKLLWESNDLRRHTNTEGTGLLETVICFERVHAGETPSEDTEGETPPEAVKQPFVLKIFPNKSGNDAVLGKSEELVNCLSVDLKKAALTSANETRNRRARMLAPQIQA